ncbi:MAG: InlB B-repeat-containing protein, partial [Clostridia bacterium]|nr:InlB B-repeat-containing protein [Clostridia bacterium]
EGWGSARATIASQYWKPGADITISCVSDDESKPTKKTIYAVWLQDDPYYYGRVVYNKNDGTTVASYSGTYSGQSNLGVAFKKINLDIPTMARTGYTLSKWNTKSDGSGTTYKDGAEFDLEMRSTNKDSPTPNHLYAIWTINQYTINFNPNGGTPTPTPKRANYDTSFSLSTYSEGVKWKNHTLIGWDTNPNATTPTFGPSATYTIKGDATLYAIWEIFEEIDPFYWHGSDTADNSYFKANYLAENAITYLNWNALKKKVKECRDKIDGATYTYKEVKPWDDFSYREFNEVRNEIAKISGHGTLPSTVSAYQ